MKRVLLVLAAIALLLPSCKKENKEEQTALAPLKVGAMSSLDYLPYVIAEKMGYTDSLGLDLEIVKFFSANDRMPPLGVVSSMAPLLTILAQQYSRQQDFPWRLW